MIKIFSMIVLILIGLAATKPARKRRMIFPKMDIPYHRFILRNGLTLIVHEDHKAPIVAVNVWYHVGSKNEKPGKTGLAHLFEHLMFNGSEHNDRDYFQVMETIGATDLNGTTDEDRTNYFQNVPVSGLDIALWVESDRMGHLLGAVTQAKLDEQRGVVQNEKRQHLNEPYGIIDELVPRAVYPSHHPYSWPAIGSMEDLDATTLGDVHAWFKQYYGPSNAVLVLAGDITPDEALRKTEMYFGEILPGPPVGHFQRWIAKRTGIQRESIQDRVPQAKWMKIWNIPEWGSREAMELQMFAVVLGWGKTSRLYRRLVYTDQTATHVEAYTDLREIGGLFFIEVTAKSGADISRIEKAADEELNLLLRKGPSVKELNRAKTLFFSGFIRGVERIGGFGGKSDILAQGQIYKNDPGYYKTLLTYVEQITPGDLRRTACEWLTDGAYILEVHPFPEYARSVHRVDRSQLPQKGRDPVVRFPEIQRDVLANGIPVWWVERPSVPVIHASLIFDVGISADAPTRAGAMQLLMALIDEGTHRRNAMEISEALADLGTAFVAHANLDMSFLQMNSLETQFAKSLNILSDIALHPVFPEKEFQRLQKLQLAAIEKEKVTPVAMALRVLPRLLYSETHPYSIPFTGSGYIQTVQQLTRNEVEKYYQQWFGPSNAALLLTGAVSYSQRRSKLENALGRWHHPVKNEKKLPVVVHSEKSLLYLIDRPGSIQSLIFCGQLIPPPGSEEEVALEMINNILGGDFTSRLNLNLREDKHWTYGAGSFIAGARGQRPFIAYASVQADKTKEAIEEIYREICDLITHRPVTESEFVKTRTNQILQLPGVWETNAAVLHALSDMVNYRYPEDYYDRYLQQLQTLTLEQTRAVAERIFRPDNLIWVVVGDRRNIENGLRKITFAEFQEIDSDGQIFS